MLTRKFKLYALICALCLSMSVLVQPAYASAKLVSSTAPESSTVTDSAMDDEDFWDWFYDQVKVLVADNSHATEKSMEIAMSVFCPTNHGDTLAEIIDALRWEESESFVALNDSGEKLCDYTTNGTSEVLVLRGTEDFLKENHGNLVIHNHPSGGAFSAGDLELTAKMQVPWTMIVSAEYVYLVSVADGDRSDPQRLGGYHSTSLAFAYMQIEDCYKTLAELERARQAHLQHPFIQFYADYCETYGDDLPAGIDHAELVERLRLLWISHTAMLDTAEHFGLEYYRYSINELDIDALLELISPDCDSSMDVKNG